MLSFIAKIAESSRIVPASGTANHRSGSRIAPAGYEDGGVAAFGLEGSARYNGSPA
jgi:hypothetical protein